MSSSCLLILPLAGALIAIATALATCLWLRRQADPQPACLVTPTPAADASPDLLPQWQAGHLDLELDLLITRHLDDMVKAFKEQIPMASMFLSQAREDKLKGQAHAELIKAIPEIKQLVLDKLTCPAIDQAPLAPLQERQCATCIYSLCAFAAIFGASAGLLTAWLLSTFCQL